MKFRYVLAVLLGLLLVPQGASSQATSPELVDPAVTLRVQSDGARLSLAIVDADGAQRSVALSEQLLQVLSLHRAGDRALVVGRLDSPVPSEVSVVDWTAGTLVDAFRGWYPSVAADARAFAYVTMYEGRVYVVWVKLVDSGLRVRMALLEALRKPPVLDPKIGFEPGGLRLQLDSGSVLLPPSAFSDVPR